MPDCTLSGTGTLACVVFAIVIVGMSLGRSTKPHRQECLCHLRL